MERKDVEPLATVTSKNERKRENKIKDIRKENKKKKEKKKEKKQNKLIIIKNDAFVELRQFAS